MILTLAVGLATFAAVGLLLGLAEWAIMTPLTRRERTIARLMED